MDRNKKLVGEKQEQQIRDGIEHNSSAALSVVEDRTLQPIEAVGWWTVFPVRTPESSL